MYNQVKRDKTYISHLEKVLLNKYGIVVTAIEPAKRGFYGETWKVSTVDARYFVKIVYAPAHKPTYENSFFVLDYLKEQGITFISEIVRTRSGQLSTTHDSAILGVFKWVDGENIENDFTKILEYKMLGKIYTVPTAPISKKLRKDCFSTKSAKDFYKYWELLKKRTSDAASARVSKVLEERHDLLIHRRKRLAIFSSLCEKDLSDFYITHGDAGGNVITNGTSLWMVDWDDPRLSAPERDAWFCMNIPSAMEVFHSALQENQIAYTLRKERLAYYCYHSFFYYLNENLEAFFELSIENMDEKIVEYFDGWVEKKLLYADTL